MNEGTVNEVSEKQIKSKRHRKKGLIKALQQQLEFYFGDVNLSKDRFLSQLIQQSPYIDLEVLMQFNKIKHLSSDIKDIQKAVSNSTLLKLSDDETKVCRITPLQVKQNSDQCTIYVEGLSNHVIHEGVQSLFTEFGKVVYVSLPKYRLSKQVKGFAFVEFDSPDAAMKAVQAYKASGSYIASDLNPAELCSIKTFETPGEQYGSSEDHIPSTKKEDVKDSNKVKSGDKENSETPGAQEKRKRLSGSGSDGDSASQKKLKVDTDIEEEDKQKLKKKRNRIKKPQEVKEAQSLTLRILSKVDWKHMRNAYLDMQRKNMKQAKQNWRNFRTFNENPQYVNKAKEEPDHPVINEGPIESKPDPKDFIPGVILKLELPEPISDVKRFKAQVKTQIGVAYVDANECSTECLIRCESQEAAQKLLTDEVWPQMSVLIGDDEKNYWDKIFADRAGKKSKATRSKERGMEKLKRKTAKMEKAKRTHTFFDGEV